jgi:hypothetical protein
LFFETRQKICHFIDREEGLSKLSYRPNGQGRQDPKKKTSWSICTGTRILRLIIYLHSIPEGGKVFLTEVKDLAHGLLKKRKMHRF